MEITIKNTSPQMVSVKFDDGEEYELQPEALLSLSCPPGSEIEVEEGVIKAEGIASPTETEADELSTIKAEESAVKESDEPKNPAL